MNLHNDNNIDARSSLPPAFFFLVLVHLRIHPDKICEEKDQTEENHSREQVGEERRNSQKKDGDSPITIGEAGARDEVESSNQTLSRKR